VSAGRHEPLLPNTRIVAVREYRERVKTRLFLVSTLILAAIAAGVALGPIAFRALDQASDVVIVVTTPEEALTARTVASLQGVLNLPPTGVDPADFESRYRISALADAAAAVTAVADGRADGALLVERVADGGLAFELRTAGAAGSTESQLIGFGALATAILDWQSTLPGETTDPFRPPLFAVVPLTAPTDAGRPLDPAAQASRSFLGIAFVVLIFITLIIYGMWVASGVAAEKSSRVMELMISAASPVQLLVGKVVGLGLAGLTQYVAILVPALLILLLQDRLASFALGPAGLEEPLVGLTPPLLGAFLLFFVLGFALYALVYASAGSVVSRPEDLQVVALPLSLISMAGYLVAIVVLGGATGPLVVAASLVPFWSPFVMLARVMVSQVPPAQLALSIGILVVSIAIAVRLAVRIYAAGVLLYGQRPGLRTFVAVAREAR
jgi:ABC-2 type transport system permease protein